MVWIFLFYSLFVNPHYGLITNEIIYAVNCGGEEHNDVHGVPFQADRLKMGIASDHGKRYSIERVSSHDAILYQTERYHHSTFSYFIPIKENGEYVLVLKFSEVYFQRPNQKVFDVEINGETVIEDLDIFARAGHGIAHDEIIPFTITNHKLTINNREIDFDDTLEINFVKKQHDNPKINAFYIIKGNINDVPKLPPLTTLPPPVEEDEPYEETNREERQNVPPRKHQQQQPITHASGPPKSDPYENDESSFLLPIVIAVAAFIPVVFCLCKI